MIVKLLTEHHLEFLSLRGGCTGSSESTLVNGSYYLHYRLLIDFAEDSDSPSWRGYAIAMGLLVLKVIQVFCNRQLHGMYYVNLMIQVRSALTSLIYKKVGTLFHPHIFGPRRNKTCLLGFPQSQTKTSLLSYKDLLEN